MAALTAAGERFAIAHLASALAAAVRQAGRTAGRSGISSLHIEQAVRELLSRRG